MTLSEQAADLLKRATPGDWMLGEYNDSLGYDCMTGGVRAGPAVLDGADYGQKRCKPIEPEDLERMLADAALIALAPSFAAEVVRLTEAEAEYVLRLGLLQFAENQANFKLREAERKLAEIHAIACGPWSECADGHEDAGAKRRMHLEQIATLSKEPSHG
jgi:hypothetical protein